MALRHNAPRRTALARTAVVGIVAAVLAAGPAVAGTLEESALMPPGQPTTGPGGNDYPYPGEPIRSGVNGLGGYTIYEPNPVPTRPVPLVLFMRGACPTECSQDDANNMMNAWRGHLVRKGNIVVFPHYQNRNGDDPVAEEERILGALTAALRLLEGPGHARPDLKRFGIAGHSRGSQMALNVASIIAADHDGADVLGLPRPRWLLVVEPGPTSRIRFTDSAPSTRPGTLADIPGFTRLVVVVGDQDTLARETKARRIWAATSHLGKRSYVYVRSDRRNAWGAAPTPFAPTCDAAQQNTGQYPSTVLAACASTNLAWTMLPRYNAARDLESPAAATGDLTADHFFPGTGNPLDKWILWKFSQGLVECSDGEKHSCRFAFGGTPEQRDTGMWSDGRPVRRPCVADAEQLPEHWDEEVCGD